MLKNSNANEPQLSRRAFVVSSVLVAALTAASCAIKSTIKPPKILFVCQAGTAKSAIAREIFKKRAQERGIAVDVFSRGLVIEDHLSPALKAKLRQDGIDTAAEPALPLAYSDWTAADILINFNPLPTSVRHKDVRDWTDVPSVNDGYADARAILDKRIDELLNELAKKADKR